MASSKNWDSVASSYEKHVFNVFQSDTNQLLINTIKEFGNKEQIAGDFGCGVGRALPLLSDRFKKVHACDFSTECIKVASSAGLRNVFYKSLDLSMPSVKLTKVDFGLCVNVAISDSISKNTSIIDNVLRGIKKGGTVVFVLPSWESVSMVSWRTMQIYGKEGIQVSEIPDDFLEFYTGKKADPKSGIFTVDGIPAKHYLISELVGIFERPRFEIAAIEKIDYDWTTELANPPAWLGYPFPWDWMIIVKKS